MKTVYVGVGELCVSNKGGEEIKTMALGSCVSLVVYALPQKVAGLLHIALPESSQFKEKAKKSPGYFTDTGIPALLKELRKKGVKGRTRLYFKIAGGANVIGGQNFFKIGERNVLSIRQYMKNKNIPLSEEDVGGNISRTVRIEVDTGRTFISSPGRGEWEI